MVSQSAFRYVAVFIAIVILMALFNGLLTHQFPGLLPTGFPGSDMQYTQKASGLVTQTSPGGIKGIPAAARATTSPDTTITAFTTDPVIPAGTVTITSPAVSTTATATPVPVPTSTSKPVSTSTTLPSITTTGTPVETVPTGPPAGKNDISIYRQVIYPHSVTITQGTTVLWTNRDNFPRSVESAAGAPASFNSGLMNPGATYEYTFTQRGSYQYQTGVAPIDSAVIIVV